MEDRNVEFENKKQPSANTKRREMLDKVTREIRRSLKDEEDKQKLDKSGTDPKPHKALLYYQEKLGVCFVQFIFGT